MYGDRGPIATGANHSDAVPRRAINAITMRER
jgi:hypothetical protein